MQAPRRRLAALREVAESPLDRPAGLMLVPLDGDPMNVSEEL